MKTIKLQKLNYTYDLFFFLYEQNLGEEITAYNMFFSNFLSKW